jgi:2-polyprenyl-6-hydroxyphenyl methylase/3-demethylubiquinone-9 3-methyltransferase
MPQRSSVDAAEVGKFEAMAAEWWDPEGQFKPLHMMNPCRLDYVTRQIGVEYGRDLTVPRPFEGLRLLDIGCGGGLTAEPMARLGAAVVGADAAEGNIAVARTHAAAQALPIDYRHTTAEALVEAGETFDAVLAMEVIEHVAEPLAFLEACRDLVRPGGLMIVSTLNRTARSYVQAILGAEVVLRWLPPGTHDWRRFVTPDELYDLMRQAGFDPVDRTGMVFDPLAWRWSLSRRELGCNYLATAQRPVD